MHTCVSPPHLFAFSMLTSWVTMRAVRTSLPLRASSAAPRCSSAFGRGGGLRRSRASPLVVAAASRSFRHAGLEAAMTLTALSKLKVTPCSIRPLGDHTLMPNPGTLATPPCAPRGRDDDGGYPDPDPKRPCVQVAELKTELQTRGLATSGLKAELVERLAADLAQAAPAATAASTAAPPPPTRPPRLNHPDYAKPETSERQAIFKGIDQYLETTPGGIQPPPRASDRPGVRKLVSKAAANEAAGLPPPTAASRQRDGGDSGDRREVCSLPSRLNRTLGRVR